MYKQIFIWKCHIHKATSPDIKSITPKFINRELFMHNMYTMERKLYFNLQVKNDLVP